MHYAAYQNAAQLQAVMGHDETQDTLFAHYRAVKTTAGEWITKAMAQQFWKSDANGSAWPESLVRLLQIGGGPKREG